MEWIFVALASCLFVAAAANWGWFGAVDNRIYDLASGLAAPDVDDRILLVEIDEPSLRQLGRWPWPREVHASALNTLARYRPAATVYDVLFLDGSAQDAQLHDALVRAHPVYIPAVLEQGRDGQDHLAAPVDAIASGAANVGIAQVLADDDGVVRSAERALTIAGARVEQLPTLLAGEDRSPGRAGAKPDDRFLIAYAGRNAFRRVSFASIAGGEVPPSLVAGKLVFVGATASGLGDNHSVPISAGSILSGIELQANILNTMLQGEAILPLPPWWMALFALFPLIVMLAGFLYLSPSRNAVLAPILIAATVMLSLTGLLFAHLWLPPTASIVGLILMHALWGWRRLTVINRFLVLQAIDLLEESGVVAPTRSLRLAGDIVGAEALRLQDVIQQVRELRAFIGRVIERFPDAVFVVDGDERIKQLNSAAIGLAQNSAVGCPFEMVSAEITGTPMSTSVAIRHKSGRILLRSEAAIDDGHRIVSFADITDLQRAADERDDLLQFLSHDLRTPNAAIVWLLESHEMEAGPNDQEPLPQQLRNKVKSYANHSLKLADSFVQLVKARRRALADAPVDLCDVAREAADMVTAYARKRGTRLENESDGGELWVIGDQNMLARALINLLENAVKFAPDNSAVVFGVTRKGNEVILSVAGPGPAMPAGRQTDPFALYAEGRSADGKGSLGLGLAFVQTTAHRHGGRAVYSYRKGYGAEFQIKLPLATIEE